MDQSQLNSLDPKLREAYERIMGTSVRPNQTQTPAVTPQSPISSASINPAANTLPDIQKIPAPAAPAAQNAQPKPSIPQNDKPIIAEKPQTAEPLKPPVSSAALNPLFDTVVANDKMHAYVASEVAEAKQSIKAIQLMYIGGAIVFFVVYAIFWLKFFNLSSPF